MTKCQARRRAAYLRQLAKCGFRSWKRANQRRLELADIELKTGLTTKELVELNRLQRCQGLWFKWRSNDQEGRKSRFFYRKLKKYGIKLTADHEIDLDYDYSQD